MIGRPDICFVVSSLSRFGSCPREGHLDLMKHMFGYLKQFPTQRILVDSTPINLDNLPDVSALRPDAAAAHMHRRLHLGVKRMAALPALTADAPPNVAKARHSACPHCVTANASHHPHKSDRYEESAPGRLIHADIAGPFVDHR